MSLDVGSLVARLDLDTSAFQHGLADVDSRMNRAAGSVAQGAGKMGGAVEEQTKKVSKLGGAIDGLGKQIAGAFAGAAVVGFFKDSAAAASDMNETISKSQQIFGTSADSISKWGDSAAKALGLSKQAAIDSASSFGDMFQQIGFSQQQATSFSQQVVQMAADLGSFNNLDTSDVLDKISGAFRGEYDSLQALLPNISATRVQQEALTETHKKNVAQLTAAEKATATWNLVMKDGARAAGDFSRTADGLANTQKSVAAQFEDTKAKVGQALLPAMKALQDLFAQSLPVIEKVGTAVGGTITFIAKLPGPVKLAAVGLGALAFVGPKVAAAIRLIKQEMAFATYGMGSFAGGLSKVVKFAGAAVAFAAFSAAISSLTKDFDQLRQAEEELGSETDQLATQLEQSGGKITDAIVKSLEDWAVIQPEFKKLVAAGIPVADLLDLLTGKADSAGPVMVDFAKAVDEGRIDPEDLAGLQKFALGLGKVVPDAQGAAKALDDYRKGKYAAFTQSVPVDALRALHGDTDAAVDAMGRLGQSIPVDALRALHGDTSSEQDATDFADHWSHAFSAYERGAKAADTAGQLFFFTMETIAGRAPDNAAQMRENAAAVRAIGTALREQAQAGQDLIDKTEELAKARADGRQKDESDAEFAARIAGLERGVAAAKDGVADANDGVAESYDRVTKSAADRVSKIGVETVKSDGYRAAVKAATAEMQRQRDAFIAQQPAADIASGAAARLADKYGLIPKKVETILSADPTIAKAKAQEAKEAAEKVPKKHTTTFDADDQASPKIKTLDENIQGLNGRSVTLNVVSKINADPNASDSRGKYLPGRTLAGGGEVHGPGTTTSDSIHAQLSDKEFVVKAASAIPNVKALNHLNKYGAWPGFAEGGQVQVAMINTGATPEQIRAMADAQLDARAKTEQNKLKAAAKAVGGPMSETGFMGSQNPAAFGWAVGKGIVPYAYQGTSFPGGVAPGTPALWNALLGRLVPTIPGGIAPTGNWGYENRANVNSPGSKSFHAYGLALDVNAEQNPNLPGTKGSRGSGKYEIPNSAEALAHSLGMLWGGEWGDAMHFEIHASPAQVAAWAAGGGAGALTGGGGGIEVGPGSGVGAYRWAPVMHQALQMIQQDTAANVAAGLHQMQTESSGNPRAINLTDSNAQKGTPSKGLMQVIDPTFRSYALSPYDKDIWDPLSNILASARYTIDRYDSLLEGWKGHAYAAGGAVAGGMQGKDSVAMWGMPGEHVLTTGDVAKLGGQSGAYRFRQLLQAGLVGPYAAGGGLGGSSGGKLVGPPAGPRLPGIPSGSAIAGVAPRQPGDREGRVIGGLGDVTAAVKEFADAAAAARREVADAHKAMTDAQTSQRQIRTDEAEAVRRQREQNHQSLVDANAKVADARKNDRESLAEHKKRQGELADAEKKLTAARKESTKTTADKKKHDADVDKAEKVVNRAKVEAAKAASNTVAGAEKARAKVIHDNGVLLQRATDHQRHANKVAGDKVAATTREWQADKTAADTATRRAALEADVQKQLGKHRHELVAVSKDYDRQQTKLAGLRDKLKGLTDAFNSTRDGIADTIKGVGGGIMGSPDFQGSRTTAADMIKGLRGNVSKASTFRGQIDKLIALGLDPAQVEEIAKAGPEGRGGVIASALAGSSKAQIAEINKLQKQQGNIGMALGADVGQAKYGAEIKATNTAINSTTTQITADAKAMAALGDKIATATREAMVGHRVTMTIGGKEVNATIVKVIQTEISQQNRQAAARR